MVKKAPSPETIHQFQPRRNRSTNLQERIHRVVNRHLELKAASHGTGTVYLP